MVHKVLMFGARDWTNRSSIRRELRKLTKKYGERHLLIIEGECPVGDGGADVIAREEAEAMGIHVCRVHALFNIYGRAGGPMRNGVMKALEPDEAIGFHLNIETSRGTKNMKSQLEKAGIPVRILTK